MGDGCCDKVSLLACTSGRLEALSIKIYRAQPTFLAGSLRKSVTGSILLPWIAGMLKILPSFVLCLRRKSTAWFWGQGGA